MGNGWLLYFPEGSALFMSHLWNLFSFLGGLSLCSIVVTPILHLCHAWSISILENESIVCFAPQIVCTPNFSICPYPLCSVVCVMLQGAVPDLRHLLVLVILSYTQLQGQGKKQVKKWLPSARERNLNLTKQLPCSSKTNPTGQMSYFCLYQKPWRTT